VVGMGPNFPRPWAPTAFLVGHENWEKVANPSSSDFRVGGIGTSAGTNKNRKGCYTGPGFWANREFTVAPWYEGAEGIFTFVASMWTIKTGIPARCGGFVKK